MEEKTIDNKKKEEVIRFKTTTDHKAKIERAAEKRGKGFFRGENIEHRTIRVARRFMRFGIVVRATINTTRLN